MHKTEGNEADRMCVCVRCSMAGPFHVINIRDANKNTYSVRGYALLNASHVLILEKAQF